jgi:hypothetical protein
VTLLVHHPRFKALAAALGEELTEQRELSISETAAILGRVLSREGPSEARGAP